MSVSCPIQSIIVRKIPNSRRRSNVLLARIPSGEVILAMWILKEHLSWLQEIGIALAVAAAVLLSF
jgi:drug/metabolite transporter (DMT)-like permease